MLSTVFMAPQKEFESPTFRLGGGRSILLSYWGVYTQKDLTFSELSLTRRTLSKWLSASLCSVAICTPPAGGVSLAELLGHIPCILTNERVDVKKNLGKWNLFQFSSLQNRPFRL